MNLTIHYLAQLRMAAGCASESLTVPASATATDLLVLLAEAHGLKLRDLLLDPHGKAQPTVLIFVGEEQVDPTQPDSLRDGDSVTLLTPIAGGI
jgi:molybdopterin converting factor small subunit